jgi:hypothetical protein
MYPIGTGPTLTHPISPPIKIKDLESVESELGGDALPKRQAAIPIHTIEA